jgi:uncharacterized protein YifE (UPF0438 family)
MTETTQIPSTLVPLLIVAITALAGVIAYLFRYYSKRLELADTVRLANETMHAKERAEWYIERTALRGEYEAKHRAIVEDYGHTVRELYEGAKAYETSARKEFVTNVELVSDQLVEASTQIVTVLDKFYDRLTNKRKT